LKFINFGDIGVNLFVTLAVLVFVVLMPAVDIWLCRLVGIDVQHNWGTNPHADKLLRMRKLLLGVMLLGYVCIYCYITFFSRAAHNEYRVKTDFFAKFFASFQLDKGFGGFVDAILHGHPLEAFRSVHILDFKTIAEVYLNVMLYVPFGYLIPYVFAWFRTKPRLRVTAACFLISLLTENIQLVTKVGFYDLNDLVTNTLGGLVGAGFFVWFAFVATSPNWRKELKRYRRWRRNARQRTLYPFARNIDLSRTTLLGTDEGEVYDFYIRKLGFRPVRQLLPENSVGTSFLLEMGESQVEIRCSNEEQELPEQFLNISARRLDKIRDRLEKSGIACGEFQKDPYTDTRQLTFEGPDHVHIVIIETA
jgi:glycopeptide antibiotics resistance protein